MKRQNSNFFKKDLINDLKKMTNTPEPMIKNETIK